MTPLLHPFNFSWLSKKPYWLSKNTNEILLKSNSVTSMSPCMIRTSMATTKCTLQADGSKRLRNADAAIAPPNILQYDSVHTRK